MAISVQDLDQLLGYDPATHSVAGIPSMKSAQPAGAIPSAKPMIGTQADVTPVPQRMSKADTPMTPPLSANNPVARADLAYDMGKSGMRTAAPMIPTVSAPSAGASPEIPTAAVPSAMGASIPSIAPPTTAQSHAAGKAEFAAGMPQVTAAPFTPEYYQQQRELSDYKQAHPFGADVSAKPGVWGKIEHGLAKAGNIAGDIFAPGTMALIPGTDLNNRAQRGAQQRGFAAATEGQERQAQTANLESETALRNASVNAWKPMGEPKQDPTTGQWFQSGTGKDATGQEVTSWKPLTGGPTNTPDQTKQPVGDTGASQFSQQLGTLTAGMSPEDQQKFTQAYGIKPNDTGATAEKRLADAKAAAQMTGAERDRKVQEDATAAQREFTNKIAAGELAVKQAGENKGGTDVVRGYDKDGVPHLTSEADAKAQGLTKITKATDKDIDSARTHNVVLNDMQAKLNDVVHDSGALNQNEGQRAIIAKALSDEKNTTFQSLLTSGVLSQASEPTKAYIQSVLSLRESALGLPKEITGGSRVSEVQSSALWATLPSAASLDSKYALSQAKKFQANIDRLWQRVDAVEGMTHEQPAPEIGGKTEFKAPEGAPPAKGVPDGKVLKDEKGNVVAVAHGGEWSAP